MSRTEERMMEAEVAAEVARIVAEYPRMELRVSAIHETRDMSVFHRFSEDRVFPFAALRKGEALDTAGLNCGKITAVDVSEERVVLHWDPKEYEVTAGSTVKTDSYAIDNPYLSYEGLSLKFEYKHATAETVLFDRLHEICDTHARTEKSLYPETTRQETFVLRLLDELTRGGARPDLYVLKVLLAASNNWSTGEIIRPHLFREQLLEGIERGCLAPENTAAWEWLETAAANNDPAEFMDDKERYYDLLATAAENGNEIALGIMNTIWEPERIIEED